ncbi:hypothetical protein OF83DRAFT_1063404, partial [Amylostereum chailletii]
MTDFCSQGRSREYNIVDLHNCRSCQSVYTCLSRSTNLENTLILQDFAPSKLQGGISGYLCQEFRELEILDEITRLRFEGSLDPQVTASTRRALIRQFQDIYGTKYVPEETHKALDWSRYGIDLVEPDIDSPWKMLTDSATTSTKRKRREYDVGDRRTGMVAAQGSHALKQINHDYDAPRPLKKCKVTGKGKAKYMRKGEDANTWSCVYDSLLTILYNLFLDDKGTWAGEMQEAN